MLRRKVPDELFAGRRTLPHELFGRDDVGVVPRQPRLGARRGGGRARRRGAARRVRPHPPAGAPARPRVVGRPRARRTAIGSTVWSPRSTRSTPPRRSCTRTSWARSPRPTRPPSARRSPRATDALGATLDEHDRSASRVDDLFGRIVARWDGEPPDRARIGVALDVVLVHLASMSNLFAGLGWTIVELLARPDLADRVRGRRPPARPRRARSSRSGCTSARSCCATCSSRSRWTTAYTAHGRARGRPIATLLR